MKILTQPAFPLFFLLCLISQISIFPQTIIKEKIDIKPSKSISVQSNPEGHSLKFELNWTPAANTEGRITVTDFCGNDLSSGWSGGGSVSVNIAQARGYRYYFLFEGRRYYGGQWHNFYTFLNNAVKAIYLDDQPYPLPTSQIGGYVVLYYSFGIKFDFNYLCYPSDIAISMPGFTSCDAISLWGSDIVTYTITEGADYTSFYDRYTDQLLGDVVKFRLDNFSNMHIILKQDKISQNSTITVKAEASVTGHTASATATILPSHYQISAGFATNKLNIVKYNTSESINIHYKANCGYLTPDIKYSASIVKGSRYGELVDPGRGISGNEINGIERSFGTATINFNADGDKPADPDTVIIKFSMSDSSVDPYFFKFLVSPGTEIHMILLGATKYYYAVEENGKLTIKETKDPASNPGLSTVTFDDPSAADGSEKNPVYWEYKYPEYSGNKFVKMDPLPEGMIRLVGRYWEDGKTFKTKLTANNKNDKPASIEIEVVKPDKLGTTPEASKKDVYGKPQDLDKLLFEFAGKYGIPPQILKADIEKESSFNPGYRWEPFVDARIQHKKLQYMDDDFRYKKTINPKSEGNPGIPTDHTNVQPIPYPQNDYSFIWDRFYNQSKTVNPKASVNNYYKSLWPHNSRLKWQDRYDKKYIELVKKGVKEAQAKAEAITYANEYFSAKLWNGIMSKGVAQTRSAASYGLMQIMYTSAVEYQSYPLDRTSGSDEHLPEYINIANTNLTYAVPFLLSKINAELVTEGDGNNKLSEWTKGFEATIIYGLNMYNGKTSTKATEKHPDTRYNWHYGFDVLKRLKSYLPATK